MQLEPGLEHLFEMCAGDDTEHRIDRAHERHDLIHGRELDVRPAGVEHEIAHKDPVAPVRQIGGTRRPHKGGHVLDRLGSGSGQHHVLRRQGRNDGGGHDGVGQSVLSARQRHADYGAP